jgi:hypothetical protein
MPPNFSSIFFYPKRGRKCSGGSRASRCAGTSSPDPPRLFRGYKRVTETPESYENFDKTVKLYLEIFKLR